MLISLSVKNFRSIGGEANIALIPDKSRSFPDHILDGDMLKTCAIFGQNGSGKSTIVQALNYLKCAINSDRMDSGLCRLKTNPNEDNVIIDMIFACRSDTLHQSIKNVMSPPDQWYILHPRAEDSVYRYLVEIDPHRPKLIHEEIYPLINGNQGGILYNSNKMNIVDSHEKNADSLMAERERYNEEISTLESELDSIIRRREELRSILSSNSIIDGELDIDNEIIVENEKKRLDQIQKEMVTLQKNYRAISNDLRNLRWKLRDLALDKDGNPVQRFLVPLRGYNPRLKFADNRRELEEKVRPSIRTWILNTLEIIDTKGYVLESLDSEELDRLSEIVSEFDVGIEAIKWQPICDHSTDELSKIDSIIFEADFNTREKIKEMIEEDYVFDRSLSFNTAGGIFKITNHKGVLSLYQLMTRHHDGNMFPINSESDGTRRVIELASILLPNDSDHVYVVDELDYRLHPVLITKFLKKYYACESKGRKQLIFTTHETNILSRDLFRLDEIWMADQDDDGSSYYTRVSEMGGKINKKLEDLYLKEGKLGGIPQIKDS